MQAEVVESLATFLDAIPYQVNAWDKRVVDGLTNNLKMFQAFKAGCNAAKWSIYAAIRYQS